MPLMFMAMIWKISHTTKSFCYKKTLKRERVVTVYGSKYVPLGNENCCEIWLLKNMASTAEKV